MRRNDDQPGDLLVLRPTERRTRLREPGNDVSDQVVPEVRDHGDERPQVECDVERLVECLVLFQVGQSPSHGTRIR